MFTLNFFSLAHVPSNYMEEGGFKINTVACNKVAIKTLSHPSLYTVYELTASLKRLVKLQCGISKLWFPVFVLS